MNPASAVDAMEDFDSDGLTNLEEFQLGTGLRVADTDTDGLKDGDERGRGTNPLLRDTDGDGFGDGLEVESGTDPLDPSDFPQTDVLTSVTITAIRLHLDLQHDRLRRLRCNSRSLGT